MAINYNDTRFQQVENEEATALRETKGTYDKMINNTDTYYQQQIDASKEWANKQNELQQAQTDFTIEKVEQQKAQAEKQYTREQKGAYTDYQKATNQYGANAETLASQGLQNTGYAESTRTNMYNTYQNRYMAARESYNQAVLNYDNSIKEAQLANSSALAQIAHEALQKQLELSLQGFQYKNQLVLQKLDAVNQTKDRYYQRWQNVQSQINTENALAEQIRQYNESLAEQRRQYNETMAFQKEKAAQDQARWEKEYALSVANSRRSSSGGGGGGGSSDSETLTDNSNETLKDEPKNNNKDGNSKNLTPNATKLYKTMSALSSRTRTLSGVDSAVARNNNISQINNAYQKGSITQSDVKLLFKRLGYE